MWKAFHTTEGKWCSFNFSTVARSAVPIFVRPVGSNSPSISFLPHGTRYDLDFWDQDCSWPPSWSFLYWLNAALNVHRIMCKYKGSCVYYAMAETIHRRGRGDLMWLTVKGVQVHHGSKSPWVHLGGCSKNRSGWLRCCNCQEAGDTGQGTTPKAFTLAFLIVEP